MAKLLTIDAGNSNVVLGLYNDDNLVHQWRIHTDRSKLVDEYADLLDSLLEKHNIKSSDIDDIALSCVVPCLRPLLESLAVNHFGKEPFFVSYKNKMNIFIKTGNKEIGADLIAGAAAAVKKYGAPCIIIDFGTATTFSAINQENEFVGAAIASGLAVSCEALYSFAPHLPRIRLESPPSVMGTNTIQAMQAGIYTGYIRMIEGLVKDMLDILGKKTKRIATGGLAETIQKSCSIFDAVDPQLVLDGIKLLFEMNR
jgi:type III pantothenate kinase